jgi:hypothetical protein
MGYTRNAYKILVGKPQGKKPLVRPRRRWRLILEWITEMDEEALTGFIWLRVRSSGG